MTRKMPLVIGLLLILAAAGMLFLVFFRNEIFPDYSPGHRGLLAAREAGCFSCHVQVSGQGALNPLKTGGRDQVPNPFTERHEIPWIRRWIENGVGNEEQNRRESGAQQRDEALVMPAFGDQLSAEEIDDLVSFVALAQYGQTADRIPDLPDGERIARRYACYTCHGELGQGGVANPGALKGYIPGFFGEDFRSLTRNGNRQDIREWILDGHSQYFWNLGIAGVRPGRFFGERQVIQMPAFRDFVSEEELEPLTDHLIELMNLGPLDAEALLAYRPLRSRAGAAADLDAGRKSREGSAPAIETMPVTFLAARTVLEQHCVTCHGPDRQKSRFRMHRRDLALQGGELAQVTGISSIEPGHPEESLMIRYVTAAESDPFEEIYPMPPDGNPRLTPSEVEILRRWIQEGVPWPDGVELLPNTETPRGTTE